jgi:hypothetical protein
MPHNFKPESMHKFAVFFEFFLQIVVLSCNLLLYDVQFMDPLLLSLQHREVLLSDGFGDPQLLRELLDGSAEEF